MFAKRSFEPDVTTGYGELLDGQNLLRVYLDELVSDEHTLGIDIIRLVVESEETAKRYASQLVEQARQVPDAVLRREIVELIETILLYKFPRLTREEIEAMFTVSDLKKTKVYQEALQEGREEGREKGREEGREEGLREGLRRVAREMLACGMPVEQVHQMTKLSLQELQKLDNAED